MILRPADSSGDILPVLSSRDMLSGPETAAQLVKYRLSLLAGEWWETPEAGFFIPEQMRAFFRGDRVYPGNGRRAGCGKSNVFRFRKTFFIFLRGADRGGERGGIV